LQDEDSFSLVVMIHAMVAETIFSHLSVGHGAINADPSTLHFVLSFPPSGIFVTFASSINLYLS